MGRKARGSPAHKPMTYGELRRLLSEIGNPWAPDKSKPDDEPLPQFSTGWDGKRVGLKPLRTAKDVSAALAQHPAPNDELAEVRKELGIKGRSAPARKNSVKRGKTRTLLNGG